MEDAALGAIGYSGKFQLSAFFLFPSNGNEWRKDYKLPRLSNFYLIAEIWSFE